MSFSEWVKAASGITGSFIVFFACLFFFAAIERLAGPQQKTPFSWRRAIGNYGMFLANVAFFLAVPSLSLAASIWAQHRHIGLLRYLNLPLPILIAVTMFIRSFTFWGSHYLSHKVPLLWRLHRIHHMDTEVDVSTTQRNHPFEGFVGALLNLPLAIALGYTPWIIMLYETIQLPIGIFIHLNAPVPARLDRFLRVIIQTPSLHRLHHSTNRIETDSNFGDVLVFWDMLFGTYRTSTPAQLATMAHGLEEVRGPRSSSLLWLLVSPFLPRLTADAGPATETARASEGEKIEDRRLVSA